MGTRKISVADALKELGQQAAPEDGVHPTAEELAAYQEKQLSKERRLSIQAHLVVCHDCTRTVLDLSLFPDLQLRAPGHERTAEDEDEDWRIIEERLAAASREATAEETRESHSKLQETPTAVPSTRSYFWLRAAALFFFATTIGLTAFVVDLEYRQGDLSGSGEPRTNVHFQDLAPVGEAGNRSAKAVRIVVPVGMNSVLLFLTTESFADFERYEAELVNEADGARSRFKGLVPGEGGAFSIQLPRGTLASGTYRVELFAITASARMRLDTYRFNIDYL
jgi:hypothetical protein